MTVQVAFEIDRSDGDLVRAARGGDAAALDRIVDRYYRPVRALCARMVGPGGEAEELTQETFARALRTLDRFDAGRPLSAWLFTIAANLCRDHPQRAGRLRLLEPAASDAIAIDVPPDAGVLRHEDRGRLLAAIERLPFDLKIVIVLHFQHDLAPAEIADALAVTPNAVRIRLFRALKLLRKKLKE